ncbi:TetR/AcrR family transcriptional regulator [Saccharibacillus kuerlensis]|uniref:TetR family transcriptional regulator n=1 Tax=Saccharibacillus kuerlensis TaxID=459527 RepID=A0ABQ2KZX1_9BACL|nr:TetR/AcrR family transcriptional regulator [Saccharibacillus kuerlensis]GGN98242.1 TetR family transcriptional regulator [Saccharibacillus kuerlensis]
MSSKKEDLLRTSEALFYQNGFHAIGLKKIVGESNIAMMTLYNHFASKDELIMEVLNRRERQYMEQLNFAIAADPSERKKISESIYVRLARAHADWMNGRAARGCLFLRAKEEYGEDASHPIVQLVDGHKERLKAFIQSADSERTTSEVLQLCLLLEGATALAESEGPEIAARELIAITERLFADLQ